MEEPTEEAQAPEPIIDPTATVEDPTPESEETVVAAQDIRKWADFSEVDKATHIQSLILNTVKALIEGNPVLCIWVPKDATEEVSNMWAPKMAEQLQTAGLITPDNPNYQDCFPQLREDENVPYPMLFTYLDQQERALKAHFIQLCKEVNAKPEEIWGKVLPDISTLKAVYLFDTLMYPIFRNRLLSEAKGAADAKNGLIVPNSGIVRAGI